MRFFTPAHGAGDGGSPAFHVGPWRRDKPGTSMTDRRPSIFLTPAAMGLPPPTPARKAVGYRLVSPEYATKYRINYSLPGTGVARVRRTADDMVALGDPLRGKIGAVVE